jgi:twitching motility protein PilT
MQTLADALYQLYVTRQVSADECLRAASDPNEFLRMIGKSPNDDLNSGPTTAQRNGERPLAGSNGRR